MGLGGTVTGCGGGGLVCGSEACWVDSRPGAGVGVLKLGAPDEMMDGSRLILRREFLLEAWREAERE